MDIVMKSILKALPAALFALSVAGCGTGATRPSAVAEPPPAASAAAPSRELTDATCAEYLDLVAQVAEESKATEAAATHAGRA